MNEEQALLNESGVFVSQSRIVIAGTTYATANITSVEKRTESAKTGFGACLLFAGVIPLIMSFQRMSHDLRAGIPYLLVGAVVVGLGVLSIRRAKATHTLLFASSSGESRALVTTDEDRVDRVLAAVNEAIVSRG